jgi:hypothetical protein
MKSLNSCLISSNIYDTFSITDIKAGNPKVMAVPEEDAMAFYLLNHAVSIIRTKVHVYEPLGKYLPILNMYHEELAVRSARMFYYLLLICTRESRHDGQSKSGPKYMSLKSTYGSEIINFHTSLKGLGSTNAADKLKTDFPNVPLGKYTKFLSDIFYKGDYGSAYGGPAWGKIADVLRDFVHGVITAEMMMDTAFTLCHNNGPIFNKGMLYQSYGHEIYKILDVQRSGQIPQLVAIPQVQAASNPYIKEMWNKCQQVIGSAFNGYVDWYLVEELGSMKQYPDMKTLQVAKYGHPSKFKAKIELEAAKQELAAKAKLEELAVMVEITPGLFIKKVKRSK